MKSIPGLRLRGAPSTSTAVLCPGGCGETVLRLGSEESLSTRARPVDITRTEEGTCPKCATAYRLAVGGSSI